jgi:hypothetical protein
MSNTNRPLWEVMHDAAPQCRDCLRRTAPMRDQPTESPLPSP